MIGAQRHRRISFLTIIPIVVLLLAAWPAAAEEQATDDYAVLLALAKLEPWGTDFTKLRIQSTKIPAYRPNEKYTEEDKAIEAAIAAADWRRATELVLALLEKNYLRIKSHVYAITVYDKSDNLERGLYHRAFFDGLLGSISPPKAARQRRLSWSSVTKRKMRRYA